MTLPLSDTGVDTFASQFLSTLKGAHAALLRIQTEVQNDVFNSLLNLPSHNKQIQDQIAAIQDSEYTSAIVADINSRLPFAITIQDILDFTQALDSFATLVEQNADLFVVSINATTKRPEFVTPVSASIKSTIQTRIQAALAEVS